MEYKELIDLIKEYPDLKVIPMVDGEVCQGDEYRRWYGSFGCCGIEEYTLYDFGHGEIRIVYKSDISEIEEFLEELTDEEIQEKISKLEWKKAIFVNIDLPELE